MSQQLSQAKHGLEPHSRCQDFQTKLGKPSLIFVVGVVVGHINIVNIIFLHILSAPCAFLQLKNLALHSQQRKRC